MRQNINASHLQRVQQKHPVNQGLCSFDQKEPTHKASSAIGRTLGAWPAAKKTAHREQFDTARKEEIHKILHKHGTLLRIKRKDMPEGETLIRTMMNFTHKLGADGTEESAKFKARWCADGSQISSDQAGETSASTPKMSTMKFYSSTSCHEQKHPKAG